MDFVPVGCGIAGSVKLASSGCANAPAITPSVGESCDGWTCDICTCGRCPVGSCACGCCVSGTFGDVWLATDPGASVRVDGSPVDSGDIELTGVAPSDAFGGAGAGSAFEPGGTDSCDAGTTVRGCLGLPVAGCENWSAFCDGTSGSEVAPVGRAEDSVGIASARLVATGIESCLFPVDTPSTVASVAGLAIVMGDAGRGTTDSKSMGGAIRVTAERSVSLSDFVRGSAEAGSCELIRGGEDTSVNSTVRS